VLGYLGGRTGKHAGEGETGLRDGGGGREEARKTEKKMLNRGNKPKDLLTAKGLGVFRAKNKLFF
jgi:hypothetical protein